MKIKDLKGHHDETFDHLFWSINYADTWFPRISRRRGLGVDVTIDFADSVLA